MAPDAPILPALDKVLRIVPAVIVPDESDDVVIVVAFKVPVVDKLDTTLLAEIDVALKLLKVPSLDTTRLPVLIDEAANVLVEISPFTLIDPAVIAFVYILLEETSVNDTGESFDAVLITTLPEVDAEMLTLSPK